jgi:alpha-D-xyloside xylohydrolase
VVEQFRKFATLHYELFPYHYQLTTQSVATGVPILRPLGFQYPQDETAWQKELEVMVGPHILAAPITIPSPNLITRAVTAQVYLPAGGWVDFYNGRILNGPTLVQRLTTLDEFPLYIQQGAAIPFHLRNPDVWANPWAVNDLNRRDRSGWLYAPKAGNTLTQSSVFGGTLQVQQQGQTIHLQLTQAPSEMQVYILTTRKPHTVSIGGVSIPEATDLNTLKSAQVGWIYKASSGVVVKLKTASGGSTASIALPQ